MIRRLVVTYFAITALALALLAIPLGLTVAHREKDRLLFDAQRDADTISARVEDALEARRPLPVDEVRQYARASGGTVVVVDPKGTALVDTEHPTEHVDYSSRPEIASALGGRRASGTRDTGPSHAPLVYAAIPVSTGGKVIGAVRITYGTATLDARVRRVWRQLALLCLGVLAVVAVAGFLLARSVTRPIRRLQTASDRFAHGDATARVAVDAGPPEVRQLGSTFNRMADRLTRLLGEQERFVADASHQLRTPLTALRLRLENLGSHVDERDRAALDAAGAEVTRMSRIIDGLLLLAHDDENRSRSAPVDVAAIARDRVDVWQDAAGEKNVTLSAALPATAVARALPGAVEQLVDNLVDNALTASPPDSRVVVRVEVTAAGVELHVVDEGPGLDAAGLARAFDRFWRGPDATPGGSGLGLAIVRRLAEASGGTARLESDPGGGIDAIVALPPLRNHS